MSTAVKRLTLGEFIDQQMRERNLSGREFADLLGVANSTIVRARDPEKAPEPTLDFLVRLARATHTSIHTLVAMVVPDDVSNLDPRVQWIAERILDLSEERRAVLEAALVGFNLQNLQQRKHDH